MTEHNDWNRKVVEEFRENGGKVGGRFEGSSLLLLTTIGAKSGQARLTPLGYFPDGDRLVVVASYLGAPNHPAWYHNLIAHPEVTVEVGTETFDATAVVIEGAERDRLWARILSVYPYLAEHQAKTTRQIPLVALERSKN